MSKRRTIRRYCKFCACRNYFSKTKDQNTIVCMRCGTKKVERPIQYES